MFTLLVIFSISEDEAQPEKLGAVIGIDMRTTYSCVAIYENGMVILSQTKQDLELPHSLFHLEKLNV
jgi:molecular chaperone DnaK (HSP70)